MQDLFDNPVPPSTVPRPRGAWARETLFFALLPNGEDLQRIDWTRGRLLADHALGRPAVPLERLHVSLHGFLAGIEGDPVRAVAGLSGAAAAAAASFGPFELSFDGFATFVPRGENDDAATPGAQVLTAEGKAISELHRRLGTELRRAGFRTKSGFSAHMTLTYHRARLARRAIEPIRLAVDRFFLVHGIPRRPRYEILGEWKLDGSGETTERCPAPPRQRELDFPSARASASSPMS